MNVQTKAQRRADHHYRIYPENVPQGLRDKNRWVVWRLEMRQKGEKPTKVPYVACPAWQDRHASATDPTTWRTFAEALEIAQAEALGIGLVLTGDDDLVGIDLDGNPEENDELMGLMAGCASYTEFSPSGQGRRIFLNAKVPEGFTGTRAGAIEVYNSLRYLTVTGDRVNGHDTLLTDQNTLDRAILLCGGQRKKSRVLADGPITAEGDPPDNWYNMLSEEAKAIFNGFDSSGDDSADDYRLAKELLAIHADEGWVMDTMRSSEISRAKYDRPDYLPRTIRNAWADLVAALDVEEEPPASAGSGEEAREGEHIPKDEHPGPFIDFHDLISMDIPPTVYVVEGLLTIGLWIMAGPPKLGKTRLLQQLTLSIASGVPFLGRNTQHLRVLYYALEDPMRLFAQRGKDMAIPFEKGWFTYTNVVPTGIAGLEKAIEETGAKVVVVDTAAMIEPVIAKSNKNAYEKDVAFFKPLKAVADKYKICLIINMHTKKYQDATDAFADVQGSLGKQGMAEGTLVMRRVPRAKDAAVLHVRGREIIEDEYALKSDETSPRWRLATEAKGLAPAKQAVLEFLRVHGRNRPKDIMAATGVSAGHIYDVLRELIELGMVRTERSFYMVTNVEREDW